MTPYELIGRLGIEVAYCRRVMWSNLVFGGLFAFLSIAIVSVQARPVSAIATLCISAVLLGAALARASVYRDLRLLLLMYELQESYPKDVP